MHAIYVNIISIVVTCVVVIVKMITLFVLNYIVRRDNCKRFTNVTINPKSNKTVRTH